MSKYKLAQRVSVLNYFEMYLFNILFMFKMFFIQLSFIDRSFKGSFLCSFSGSYLYFVPRNVILIEYSMEGCSCVRVL